MNNRYYENIGESVFSEKLENGLQVYVIPKAGYSKTYAFFAVDYGAADTSFFVNGEAQQVPDGIAHFLEHKMFDMPQGNALQLLSGLGAQPNAFTSNDITAYYFETSENFEECLGILLDFVTTPYFVQDSVDKEQGIIGQEISMIENNPNWRVYMSLYKALYNNHPVRNTVAGTKESISGITAETLTMCHRMFYRPDNMVLCVVGGVDPKNVINIARDNMAAATKISTVCCYGESEADFPAEKKVVQEMQVGMPIFMAGWKSRAAENGMAAILEEAVAELAFQCIAGRSSKLYADMYAAGLINDGFEWSWELCRGAACMIFGGESKDPDKVMQLVCDEAMRIGREGIDEDFFGRLKKAYIGQLIRSFDSFEFISYSQTKAHFRKADFFEFPKHVQNITLEDVTRFIADNLRADNLAISIVNPKELS